MQRHSENGSLRERTESADRATDRATDRACGEASQQATNPSAPVTAPAHSAATRDHDDPLRLVLDPVTFEAFATTYRERAPLHVERRDASRFAGLVSTARLERLLGNAELRFPGVQLARADDPVPSARYTDEESRIVPRSLAREHASGATIVLSGAHDRLDALGALCRGLRARLGARCQANVYRSPPGARGFGPHHDAHDVIILQVEGTKTFRFHAGGPTLPLTHQRFDPETDVAGEAGEEIELHPGDTLYIPRGMMHDALAGDGGASLHVTLGLFPVTVVDVLHDALDLAASRDVALRRSAPDGPIERGSSALSALLDDALEPGILGEALARLRDEETIASRPDMAGMLAAPSMAGDPPDALMVVREDVPRHPERRGDRLIVSRPGQVMEFGGRTARAVEALLLAGRLAVGELPGLDADERGALCRRLLDEGVIRCEELDRVDPSR